MSVQAAKYFALNFERRHYQAFRTHLGKLSVKEKQGINPSLYPRHFIYPSSYLGDQRDVSHREKGKKVPDSKTGGKSELSHLHGRECKG